MLAQATMRMNSFASAHAAEQTAYSAAHMLHTCKMRRASNRAGQHSST